MKMKGKLISLISVIFILLAGMAITGCATVTPLGRAATRGDIKEVETLLNEGADVNEVRMPGLSPLHEAVFNDASLDIVRILLDKGADVNKKSCGDGWASSCNCSTPLYIAACKGNVNMVKLLLGYGADVSPVSYDKKTPLTIAQEQGLTAIVRILKKAEEKQHKELYANDEETALSSAERRAVPPAKSDVDELPAIKAKPNKSSYAI